MGPFPRVETRPAASPYRESRTIGLRELSNATVRPLSVLRLPATPRPDAQHHARVPDAAQDAVRHRDRRHLPRPRHRRQRGHLLDVRPAAPPPDAGARGQPAGQPVRARPDARLQLVQPDGQLRGSLQLCHVPRPGKGEHSIHGDRRAPHHQHVAECAQRADDGRGRDGQRQLLPGARPNGHSRAPARARRRQGHRRGVRRRARVQLLGKQVRQGPGRRWAVDRREWQVVHDRRRRTGEVRWHHRRHTSRRLCADQHARRGAALHEVGGAPQLLGVPLCAAQAGRLGGGGDDGRERCVSPDHYRRRGAAPEGDERQDDGELQEQEAAAQAGRARPELDPSRGQDAHHPPVLRHRRGTPHRLRQHREPAAGPRRRSCHRDGCPPRARRNPREARRATSHRERNAGARRRPGVVARRHMDAQRDQCAAPAGRIQHAAFLHQPVCPALLGAAEPRHRCRLRAVPCAAQHAQ